MTRNIIKYYENEICLPDEKLEPKVQISIINKQLKDIRDHLCQNASSFDDLLLSQYGYIVSCLNMRNDVWSYSEDSMSFTRRIGELWESFCKAAFYSSRITRRVNFPEFDTVKKDLLKKRVPEEIWDLVGNVNMKTDGLFVSKKQLTAIDLKYSFYSHEKGNMQRLRTVGAVYKMWKPSIDLFVLVKDAEVQDGYLHHLADYWDVKQGDAAYKKIKELTGFNLRTWIDENVNFKKHLSKSLYYNIKEKNLEKYLQW